MGAEPVSAPTTVTWIAVPNGKPVFESGRQTISKPFEGRLDASSWLLSFGNPVSGARAGGAPPPGTKAPASTTLMFSGLTVAAEIDSLKRIVMSGLVGPKIAVRTSATLLVPETGGGGGAPAPIPTALFT